MTKETNTQETQTVPQMRVLGQFVRDLSFENIASQQGVQPDAQPEVSVQVNLDAKKRPVENQYESSIKLSISSKTPDGSGTFFIMEIEYAGIFHIEGVPEEQMHPFLLIECPRMIFPFLRRVVSDVTRDGGFPVLNLENIDFVTMYKDELAKRQQKKDA